jgi:hypothetical protein
MTGVKTGLKEWQQQERIEFFNTRAFRQGAETGTMGPEW